MAAPRSGFRTFAILWGGQFVSAIGTFLTDFALGIYVYRQTNSATTPDWCTHSPSFH